MPRRIETLSDQVASRLVTGQVVERPASVVKELIENALDAGAARIDVSIRNGGKTEIRVADDGHGMGREDALLALQRHTTSRIHTLEDLSALRTLGFRGEALSAVAAVSRLTLETAEREGDGTRVLANAGEVVEVEACERPTGTTVAVRGLFFADTARAKLLRSAATEARAVSEAVITLALAHPEVAFALESDGRQLLTLPAAPELRSRIAAVWGEGFADQLIPLAHSDGEVTLTGLIQRPHSATPGNRRAYLFVNGRSFADRSLVRAVDRGYQSLVSPGARPCFFLFLDVPEGRVDVNVHPAKAEVRLEDAEGVERTIGQGVSAVLQALNDAGLGVVGEAVDAGAGRRRGGASARPVDLSIVSGGAAPELQQMSLFVSGTEEPSGDAPAVDAEPAPLPPSMWQVHDTYLFAETRGGVIIVDQHSAHERVLFEAVMRCFDEGGADSQRLPVPITLRLSPEEFGVVEELGGLLSAMGFEIEPFGGRAVIVHAVPSPHPHFDAERCLREMIVELTEGSPLLDAARTQHQRLALSFACKAAVRPGQRLSAEEMSELFDRLFATELPYQDIHGRPTVIQLSVDELRNRFGRGG